MFGQVGVLSYPPAAASLIAETTIAISGLEANCGEPQVLVDTITHKLPKLELPPAGPLGTL